MSDSVHNFEYQEVNEHEIEYNRTCLAGIACRNRIRIKQCAIRLHERNRQPTSALCLPHAGDNGAIVAKHTARQCHSAATVNRAAVGITCSASN